VKLATLSAHTNPGTNPTNSRFTTTYSMSKKMPNVMWTKLNAEAKWDMAPIVIS
jgi:hypothetical protein